MNEKCYHCGNIIRVDVTCYNFVMRCSGCNRFSKNNDHERFSTLKLPHKSVDTDERMENIGGIKK